MKPFGPFQLYVVPVLLADNDNVCPVQIGLGVADAVGAAGIGLIVTVTVPAGPVHPFSVAVTEYVPAFDEVAGDITGFCEAEVNPFGPFHEYVGLPLALALAVKLKSAPSQIGLLLVTVGVAGV